MESGERDLPLLMWFAVAAMLCMSTLVLPVLMPDLTAAMVSLRSIGGQLGAATTGMQPAHIGHAIVIATILVARHAQRVQARLELS